MVKQSNLMRDSLFLNIPHADAHLQAFCHDLDLDRPKGSNPLGFRTSSLTIPPGLDLSVGIVGGG